MELFVEQGAKVVIADIDAGRGAERPRNWVTRPPFAQTDVADPEDVQALVDFAVDRFGGLHVMFNNAGVSSSFRRLLDNDLRDLQRVMGVNLFGVMFGMSSRGPAHGRARGRIDHQHHVDGCPDRGLVPDRLPHLESSDDPVQPVGGVGLWPSTASV